MQVDRVVAELPLCVEQLDVGTPASVAAARLQLDRYIPLRLNVAHAAGGCSFNFNLAGITRVVPFLHMRNVPRLGKNGLADTDRSLLPYPRRLAALQSLVLRAGFYQELTGLPASLQSLRLHRNVVYVRLLGAFAKCAPTLFCLSKRHTLHLRINYCRWLHGWCIQDLGS